MEVLGGSCPIFAKRRPWTHSCHTIWLRVPSYVHCKFTEKWWNLFARETFACFCGSMWRFPAAAVIDAYLMAATARWESGNADAKKPCLSIKMQAFKLAFALRPQGGRERFSPSHFLHGLNLHTRKYYMADEILAANHALLTFAHLTFRRAHGLTDVCNICFSSR